MTAVRMTTGGVSVSRRGGSAGQTSGSCERTQSHYTTPGVRRERTGWRDQALSERHRLYGCDCPAVDLDFILLEYDTGSPRALVEYKAGIPRRLNLNHPTYRAIRALADASGIPCVVVFYSPAFWYFTCYPLNTHATEWFTDGETLSELEYVTRLYQLRGRELPSDLDYRLNDVLPEVSQ